LCCPTRWSPNAADGLDDLVVSEILEGAETDPREMIEVCLESLFELVEIVETATVTTDVAGLETHLVALLATSKSLLQLVKYLAKRASDRKCSEE
jgi:hypothetical protein